jgi:pilus assembly protein Flp/PilA
MPSKVLLNLLKDETGQDLIEYALVAALIGLAAIASMRTLSATISTALSSIGTKITNDV